MRITRNLIRSLTPGAFQRSLLASQSLALLLPHESSSLLSWTLTEPPELRKGRRRLTKDNNGGKELSAITSSRWICTSTVVVSCRLAVQQEFSWICQGSRGLSRGWVLSCLWESHCLCRLGARTDRLPTHLCQILA